MQLARGELHEPGAVRQRSWRRAALACALVTAAAMVVAVAVAATRTPGAPAPAPQPLYVVVDTDAGIDDLTALAMVLSAEAAGVSALGGRPLKLHAVSIVDGLAHVQAGASNVAKLLEKAGRADVPVFFGEERGAAGHAFPAAWRADADAAAGFSFGPGAPARAPQPGAQAALAALLAAPPAGPGSLFLLCLGPLTNVAAALSLASPAASSSALAGVLVMGGAMGPAPQGAAPFPNNASEWNFWVDPAAAASVLAAPVAAPLSLYLADAALPCSDPALAPLPASPVPPSARAPGRFITEGLRALCGGQDGMLYDPSAAGALLEPSLAAWRPGRFRSVAEAGSPRAGALEEVPGEAPAPAWAMRAPTSASGAALAALLRRLAGPA
eukprot:tig00001471_g8868.t1